MFLFKDFNLNYVDVCEGVHECNASSCQKRASVSLELELQVVSHTPWGIKELNSDLNTQTYTKLRDVKGKREEKGAKRWLRG